MKLRCFGCFQLPSMPSEMPLLSLINAALFINLDTSTQLRQRNDLIHGEPFKIQKKEPLTVSIIQGGSVE